MSRLNLRNLFSRENLRKKLLVASLLVVTFIALLLVAIGLYVRSEKFNQLVISQIKTNAALYGLRVEVEGFGFSFTPSQAELKNIKVFNKKTGQLLLEIENTELDAKIVDLYALKLQRQVILENLNLKGLKLSLEFNSDGTSSFTGIEAPKNTSSGSSPIEIDNSKLNVVITNSSISLKDGVNQADFKLNNLELEAKLKGATEAAIKVIGEGAISFQNYSAKIESIRVNGTISDKALELEPSSIVTSLGKINFNGQLNDWKTLEHKIEFQAETQALDVADLKIKGQSGFQGKVFGNKNGSTLTGNLQVTDLNANKANINNLQVSELELTTGTKFDFTTKQIKAQVVNVDSITAKNIEIPSLKGNFSNNSLELTLAKLSTATMTVPKTQIQRIELNDIELKLLDQNLTAKVKQALVSSANIPNGKVSSIKLKDVAVETKGSNYKVNSDLLVSKAIFNNIQAEQVNSKLLIENNILTLSKLTTNLLGGQASLDAQIALVGKSTSKLQAKFEQINSAELGKILQKEPLPITGLIKGNSELTWPGLDFLQANGQIKATVEGETLANSNKLPLNAQLLVLAQNGKLNINPLTAKLGQTQILAQGTIIPKTNMITAEYKVNSNNSEELFLLAKSLKLLDQQTLSYKPELSGKLKALGQVNGTFDKLSITSEFEAENVGLQDNKFHSLTGKLKVTPEDIQVDIDKLLDTQNGALSFNYQGKISDPINTGKLKADFQNFHLELYQPDNKELFIGAINGKAEFTQLNEQGQGKAQLILTNSKVAGQLLESAQINIILANQLLNLNIDSLQIAAAKINGQGSLNLKTKDIGFKGQVKDLNLTKLTTDAALSGIVNANLQVNGNINDLNSLQLSLQAESKDLATPTTKLGQLSLSAQSDNQGHIRAEVISYLIPAQPQKIVAIVSTNQPGYPVEIESELSELDIALVLAAINIDNKGINSKISAKISAKGNILNSKEEFSLDNFQGNLLLTSASVKLSDQALNIETPCNILLNQSKLSLARMRVFSDSSDITLSGQIGLSENNPLEFIANGTVNLAQFASLIPDSSLNGIVKIDTKLTGTVNNPNLSGVVSASSLAFSRPDLPIELRNGNGLITLNNNKISLDDFTIRANDGQVTGNGQVDLKGFEISNLKLKLSATDVNLIYQSAAMTLKGDVILEGTPTDTVLRGNVKVLEAIYSKPFDTSLINSSVSSVNDGSKSLFSPRLDLNIDANESIIVRNPQIDTVASASISVGGQLSNPNLTGRISLEGGTVTLRKQRYDITQGVLDLPGGILLPTVNVLAEGEVSTYRVFIRFTGPIDQIDLELESEPTLTRTEILALITTGRTELGGGDNQDLATTGLNTGANLIAQEFISKPFGRKAEQFLGLNQFQVDPIIRANENPSARLTLGREIIPKLSFTYSTSLGSSKDQTIALEYRLSNRFSSLFSFTQSENTSTKGNTSNSDYSLEIRGRERFALGGKGKIEKNARLSIMTSFKPLTFPTAEVIVDKPEEIKISNDTLRDLLPIKRQAFSSPLARLGQENLTNYLQEKGYFFAKVLTTCDPVDCQGSGLKVHYQVIPGTRYQVRQITITGTNLLSTASVISQLQSKEKNFVGKIPILKTIPVIGGLADGITSNERLSQDSDLIRQQLIDLGYRQATVSYSYNIDNDGLGLKINFDVTEGAISRIEEIDLRGVSALNKEELKQEISINIGDPFFPTQPREVAQKLVDYYGQKGYLDTRVDLDIEQTSNNNIRLVYQINEGMLSTVDNIAFMGMVGVNEKALLRFIELKPGEVITNRKLQKLQKDLYATGNFREIQVLTLPTTSANPTDRQVLIKLTEAKPLLLVYGLGFSSDDGPRGSIELTNTDFLNRINSASLRLRLGKREQTLQLQLTDQRPFGSRWSTTFSALYNRVSKLAGTSAQISNVDQVGLEDSNIGLARFVSFVQTERRLNTRTSIRFRYSYELNKLLNLEDAQFNAFAETSRVTRLASLSMGVSYDNRDNPINPTKGQLFSADYSIASRILGGNESFNKISTNFQYYTKTKESFPIPFINRSIIAFSSRIGLAAPFEIRSRRGDGVITDSDRLLPFSERFRSGGATTLRGFQFEQAGPQAIVESGNAPARLVSLGGDALIVLNLELRYPISKRLQLVPFYDLGNVFSRISDINFRRMSNTLGVGLRFNTPIGPVGIDYGYLLDPQSFTTPNGGILRQRQGVIHIKFGQSF